MTYSLHPDPMDEVLSSVDERSVVHVTGSCACLSIWSRGILSMSEMVRGDLGRPSLLVRIRKDRGCEYAGHTNKELRGFVLEQQ